MPNNYEAIQDEKLKNAANPDGQGQSTGAGPVATPTSGTSRVSSFSSGVQPSQAGSGRFTNLQNYIGANKGASDRLATGISGNLDRANAPVKKEVETQASNVREGIASAQGKLATGNSYLQDVSKADFNADTIAKDDAKLQDFTKFRTNAAIDANGLNASVNNAQTSAMNLQNQLQGQMKNASTEQGRFNLLKNTFGGGSVYQNPYSTGQQRLDQLFLQAGGNDNVNKIQQGIRSNLGNNNQVINALGQNSEQAKIIGTDASALANNLQTKTTGITDKFVGDIAATEAAVNAKRAADQKWADAQYKQLQSSGNIDQRFATMMALNPGQNIYNTLSDKNADQFLEFGAKELRGADQLANSQQRAYYDSLAKLAGVQNYAINAGGDPQAAVKAKEGVLQDAVAKQRAMFDAKTYNNQGWGDYGSQMRTMIGGKQLNQLIDQSGITKDTLAANRNNFYTSDIFQPIYNSNAQVNDVYQRASDLATWNNGIAIPTSSSYAQSIADGNAQQAIYDLLDSGYFHNVNIDPGDTESGGNFGVS